MNTFHIITLGCKINIYESEAITAILKKHKYKEETDIEKASIIIVNSCTVTSKADSKCRNMIRSAKRKNSNALIVVTGCMVESELNEILDMGIADIIIKNRDKDKIDQAIDYFNTTKISPFIFKTSIDGSFNFKTESFSSHSRAFLKIQDGCNNRCSYCRIPFVRGESRSKPYNDIYKEIEEIIKNGYEEIILSGINLGSYKNDNYNFTSLISELAETFKNIRFRISSIEPEYINNDFLTLLSMDNICPHLHLPLQNGSDKILKAMNRNYTLLDYYKKIEMIKNIKKDCFISTDIILGFPSENEDDFLSTIDFVKKINFAFVHIFPFSPREGTKAFNLKDKVPSYTIKDRVAKLKKVVDELNYKYRKNFIGKKLDAIIEKKTGHYYSGKTENYLDVQINTEKELIPKKRYRVILETIDNEKNICKLV